MASITKRGDKWRAEIRRKGFDPQCKTFPTKTQAQAWARGVEASMDSGQTPLVQTGSVTVAQAIRAYRKMRDQVRPIRDDSNEHYQLKMLEARLGSESVAACTPERLVSFAVERRDEDRCGPYTINLDLGKLGTVLRYSAPILKVQFPDVVGQARPLLAHMRLIGGGGKRERRPVEDEFERILAWLEENKGARYAAAVAFAAASAMRRGEVCALRVADVDVAKRLATVERKHPRKGKVLEQVPLLAASWEILQRQEPGEDGRYFPVHPQTLTFYFTEACRALSIPDLHFHDLRHEGTSRMFEEGMSIEQVALVTGHKSWTNLRRYTNLRPEDLTRPAPGTGQGAPPRPDSPPSACPGPGTS